MRVFIKLFIWVLFIQNVSAGSIKVDFEFTDIYQFNYGTLSYEPSIHIGPLTGSVIFEDSIRYATDYGNTSITTFGAVDGAIIDSPFTTSVLGTNPFGDEFPFNTQYAFGGVNDYPNTFYEEFAVIANSYYRQGDVFWDHYFGIRLARRTPQTGGNGLNDYLFTSDSMFNYLLWFMDNGEEFSVYQYWNLYNVENRTYLEGFGWGSYNGRVTSVQKIDNIPEPNMLLIFILFLGFITLRANSHIKLFANTKKGLNRKVTIIPPVLT